MRKRIKRPVARINTERQLGLFEPAVVTEAIIPKVGGGRFITPNPRDITIGAANLADHLQAMGIKPPFVVSQILGRLDWTPFESAYHANGRRAYAPRLMLGIILYGLMKGTS